MRVAAVSQHLHRRAGMHGEHTVSDRNALQVVEHVVDQIGFDMLQHIDTGHAGAGLRRRSPLGSRRIVMVNQRGMQHQRVERLAQATLACAVVEQLGSIHGFHDLRHNRRVMHGSHTVIGITVQFFLHLAVFFGNQGIHGDREPPAGEGNTRV